MRTFTLTLATLALAGCAAQQQVPAEQLFYPANGDLDLTARTAAWTECEAPARAKADAEIAEVTQSAAAAASAEDFNNRVEYAWTGNASSYAGGQIGTALGAALAVAIARGKAEAQYAADVRECMAASGYSEEVANAGAH